jgi:CBS domain-containing protein
MIILILCLFYYQKMGVICYGSQKSSKEASMKRHVIPHVVRSFAIHTLSPGATVYDAAAVMAEQSIGAVMIVDHTGRLIGIFSERDLVNRMTVPRLSPETTVLADVMTRNPVTVDPDTCAIEALNLMADHHIRHLPVVRHGRPIAMVSVRDLYGALCAELEEDLSESKAFIYSGGY